MKQVVLEFDDEEMELLEEQFKQIQDVAGMETIEDYIYYWWHVDGSLITDC